MARRVLELALENLLTIDERHLPQVENYFMDINEHPVAGADLQGNGARGLRQRFDPGAVLGNWAARIHFHSGLDEISRRHATDANPGCYGGHRRLLAACHWRLD